MLLQSQKMLIFILYNKISQNWDVQGFQQGFSETKFEES